MHRRLFAVVMMIPSLLLGSVSPALALTPNDTFYGKQWGLPHVGADRAWDVTTGSHDVIVAVIDTAMDVDHEDLKDNIWTNERETFGNGIDDDGNGYIDDIHGWNFVNRTNDVRPHESGSTSHGYLHATLVGSLLAAQGNNGIGVAGVAWHVRLMPLVALDPTGDGSTDDVALAVRYAADNGASIINLSMEGYNASQTLDDALSYARSRGVLTVAAAGNGNDDGGFSLDETPVYPGCLSTDARYGVIGVGATDPNNVYAPYANYGSCVDVSAPGDDIFGAETSIATGTAPVAGYAGGFSGTSLAVPLVAGTAALLKSLRPDWGWAELKNQIVMTADPIDQLQLPGLRGKIGRGELNIAAAVSGLATTSSTSSWSVSGTVPGRATRIRLRTTGNTIEIAPFGTADMRGARASLTDVNGDGLPEIAVVPASGVSGDWATFDRNGSPIAHGSLIKKGLKHGLLIATVPGGFVAADPDGNQAWGVAGDATVKAFQPYGGAYHAGLDIVSVPGGVAFAPRGGGGHLLVTDRQGKTLVSVFPFGKTARGRWSVSRIGGSSGQTASLVFSGPQGSVFLDVKHLGSSGWQAISLSALEHAALSNSNGQSDGVSGELLYDHWPNP